MKKLLSTMRNMALGFALTLGAVQLTHAADDAQVKEELGKFCEENSKVREAHIQQLRELHIKHINEMYDRRLASSKEMEALWKQMKPGDKENNKAVMKQIEEKKKAFQSEEEKFRKDFKENVLKVKNKEFRDSMKERAKEMKKKYKE